MTFDGRELRRYPDRIPFYAYASKAPATPVVAARALETAYAHGRLAERRVLEVTYPHDHRDPTRSREWPRGWATSGFVDVADGYRRLPAEATHLVAEVLFDVTTARSVVASHRLIVAGYSAGTETTLDLGPASDLGARVRGSVASRRRGGLLSPFGPAAWAFTARCEVAIDAGALEAVNLITVQAKLDDASSVYAPQAVTVWWEVRG